MAKRIEAREKEPTPPTARSAASPCAGASRPKAISGTAKERARCSATPRGEGDFWGCSAFPECKGTGYWIVKNYREAYGMHASNGILFNHESPRRGENFVTRKITYSLARIRAGAQEQLRLGNLDAKRDWGYAKDFVEAMWLVLQQPEPDDFVVATGETHTVREFVERAAAIAGFDLAWEGEGVDEKGIDRKTGRAIVAIAERHFRPAEVELLLGDPSKARRVLGWEPRVTFNALVELMMRADLKALGL
jgi:GDPmannose 4,6-dehydratase